jgi:hypothetical protein
VTDYDDYHCDDWLGAKDPIPKKHLNAFPNIALTSAGTCRSPNLVKYLAPKELKVGILKPGLLKNA